MWNDSDVGYTFWDEMWNEESDEKRRQRAKTSGTIDQKEDDSEGSR